ncbi:MAG: hypothetical protein ABI831_05960, partial [Betaproteobacteria bacterium]
FGLKATNNTDATASADGSAVSDGDVGIGAALALNDGHNTAEARVGQGATVNAHGVSVQALMTSLQGGKDEVSSMGARAQAGAGGKDVGVAGAVALDFETSKAEAVIEAGGTQVTTAGGDIIISAQNTTGSYAIAFGGTPGAGGANGGDVGVGAAFAMSIANNTSSAIVTDGVGMHGTSGNILITAGSADAIYTQAEAGASGGVGVAAAVALSVHTDNTTARLGSGGGVTATGGLGILAGHSNHLTTIAHGDGAGSDVGIGAAIGITIGGDTTIASLGRNVNAGGAAVIGGSSTTTAFTESKAGENGAAQSSGNADDQGEQQASFGDSKAGSNYSASEPKAQDSMDSASSETSSQDSGGVADLGVAAALSLSWTTDDVEALIDSGVVLVAGGAVTVGTVNSSDSAALALGTAILNETSIGAAVAINGLQITNHAIVGNNASVSGAGVSIFANEATNETNDFQARALAAAGGTENGIAGSVSINLITNDTLARVGTAAHIISTAGFSVAASESATLQNIAGSGAIGEDAGIGAAVAINLITNHTGAEIGNGAVTDATGATSITAHGALTPRVDADLPFNPSGLAVAGSGAIDVAVSGSVMVDIINRDTHATIGDNTLVNQSATGSAAQGLAVQASDSVKLWSGAGAVAVGISDAGIGASVHVGILNMDTRATVGNNARTKAQGQLAMSANASEDLTSIAVGLGVSSEAGIAGSFSINLVTDHTTAGFGDGSVFVGGATTARENNFITASDSTSLDSVAGAVAIGGEAGVGVGLSVGIINKTTHAGFGVGDTIDMTTGALAVSANSFESITAISANGGVGGEAGVAGSVDVYLVNTETIASLGHNSTLLGSNRVSFNANDSSGIDLAAGTIAGGGSAGVGAANTTLVRNDVTRAFVGDHSTITNGGIGLSAHSSETVSAIAAGGALGGSAGVAGSAVVNVINQTTEAFFDRDVTVTTTGAGNVGANASADTLLSGLGGALAAGGSAGIGAGVDVGVLSKVTQAYIAPGGNVNASGTVSVTARSTEDILSISAALGAGGSAAVLGSASVYPVNVTTRAFITGENADPRKGTPANPTVVHAHGDVVISASDMSHYDIISGNIGVGGSASIGAGAAVTVITKNTSAYVGTNATVSGDGVGGGTLADTGAVGIAPASDSAPAGAVKGMITDAAILARGLIGDHTVTPTQATVHGVAITATNSDELLSLAVSGGLAGSVAVNVGAGVSVMNANTTAFVADNSKVNTAAGAGADQSVLIAAGNHYEHTGIVGVASLAITASIGPAADVNVVNTNTIASIGNGAQVKAARDVAVVAKADESITSIAVAGAISAGVSVAGAVPVTVLNANTSATIGNNAKVDAGGNVLVKASDDTDLTMVGGSAGIGLYVGVGAAVDVDIITKHTDAHIGTGATVNAKGNSGDMSVLNGNLASDGFASGAARGLVVQATSSEDIFTLAATGAGGIVGVAGGVTVSIIQSDTTAYIGTNAKINTDQTGASGLQSVEVAAANSVTVSDFAGGVAGGLVGAAGGVDVGSVNNNTSAYVAGGAQVNARRDVNAYALSEQDISSLAASGAGGFVGLAGSVSVWTIGASLQTGYSDSNGNNSNAIQGGANDTGETSGDGYAAQQGDSAGSGLVDALAGYSSARHTSVAGRLDNTEVIGDNVQIVRGKVVAQKPDDMELTNAIHAGGAPGTTAYIARGATVNAGHDVQVRAKDRLEFSQTAGAVSAGFVGIGGSVTVGNIHANTTACIAGTTVAGNSVAIESRLDETYDGLTFSGQGGFVGLGASVAVVSDDSQVRAYIDNNTSVTKGDDVSVAAARTANFSTTTAQVDVGAVAAGASYTDVTVGGRSAATIGDGVIITQSASSGLGHDIAVTANSNIAVDATAYGITSGIIAGQVNYARATINPTVVASVGNYSHLTSAGNVTVQASSNDVATSDLVGVAAGGIGVSVSLSRAIVAPNVSASLGVGSTIDAGGSVAIRAQEGQSGGTSARATSIAGSGGLAGGTGADARATANVPVTASTNVNTRITAGGNVTIEALANNAASATTTGLTIGGVSLGLSISDAQSSGATRARTDGDMTAGGNVSVNARATNAVDAAATALAGGLLFGANGAVATATASPTVDAHIGAGRNVVAGGSINVLGQASDRANANAFGVALSGGVSAGASIAIATTSPNVTGYVGVNVLLDAANGVSVRALHNFDTAGNAQTGNRALANAISASGGILVGVTGTSATASANANTTSYIAAGTHTGGGVGSVNIEARSGDRVRANAGGFGVGGIAGVGLSVANGQANGTTTAHLDGSVTDGGGFNVIAMTNNDSDVDAQALAGGLIAAGAGATATATVSPNVQAYVVAGQSVHVNGGGGILAQSVGNADAQAKGVALSGLHGGGGSTATATMSPTVRATLREGATLDLNGSFAIRALHNYSTSGTPLAGRTNAVAVTSGGGMLDGFGNATATATAGADIAATADAGTTMHDGSTIFLGGGLGGGVVLFLGQDIAIDARSVNSATSNSSGLGIGGLAGVGASIARSTANGPTLAGLYGHVTGADDFSISAVETEAADARAKALGGSLGVAASGAVATATASPTITAVIAGSASVVANGDVSVVGQSIGSGNATVTGLAISGIAGVGVAQATANLNPNVSASINTGASVDAGGGVTVRGLHNYSLNLGELSGLVNASAQQTAGSLLFGGSGAFSTANGNAVVSGRINSGVTLSAGGTVSIDGLSRNVAKANTTGLSIGGVAAGGDSIATANASGSTIARLDSNLTLGGALSMSAISRDTASTDSTALNATFGFGISGQRATSNVAPTVSALVAPGLTVNVNGRVDLFADALTDAVSTARGTGLAGLVSANASRATAQVTPVVSAGFGGGSNITGRGGIGVRAYNNFDAAGNQAAGGAEATATSPSVSILVAISGADANATTRATVTGSAASNSTLFSNGDISFDARSAGDAHATTSGAAGGGFVGLGATRSTAVAQDSISAGFDGSITGGHSLSVYGLGANTSAADSSAHDFSGFAAIGSAVSTATTTTNVQAFVRGSAITLGGDLNVTAQAFGGGNATAKGDNFSFGGSFGRNAATTTVTPTARAVIDGFPTINVGGSVNMAALQNYYDINGNRAPNPASASATASGGGALFGIGGANSTATSTGTADSYIASGVVLNAGNVNVRTFGDTEADDAAGAAGGGFFAGVGTSHATSNATLSSTAHIDGRVVARGSMNIHSEGLTRADAHGDASTGGVVSSPLNDANATARSTVAASVGNGANIRTVGNLSITTQGSGSAASNSRGESIISGGNGGQSTANATVNTDVKSRLGDGSRVDVGGLLRLDTGYLTFAGDYAKFDGTANGDRTNWAGAYSNASGGVALLGSLDVGSQSNATTNANFVSSIGNNASVTAGAVVVTSSARRGTDAEAKSSGFGVFVGEGGAVANSNINGQTNSVIGFGAVVVARGDVLISANGEGNVARSYAERSGSSVFVASSNSVATSHVSVSALTDVQSGAAVYAQHGNIKLTATGGGYAQGSSHSDSGSAFPNAYAEAQGRLDSSVYTHLGSNALLSACDTVTLSAYQGQMYSNAFTFSHASGAAGSSATGKPLSFQNDSTTVGTGAGSRILASNLFVEANTDTPATPIGWDLYAFGLGNSISLNWGNNINYSRTIDFNSNVVLDPACDGDPILIIDQFGNVVEQRNVTFSRSGSNIVVNPILNHGIGTATFSLP